MRRIVWFVLLGAALFGCSTTPTPTPIPTPPGNIIVVTATPIVVQTLVPVPTLLPTVIVATGTVVVPTASSGSKAGATTVAHKYSAPIAVGPNRPTVFNEGNDITFTYASVGPLLANECYLLHVELVNPDVPTKNNRGDDFLDKDSCGDQSKADKHLNFILFRGKFINSPNYGTIESQALALAPDVVTMKMTWNVKVVQNNGLSPDGVHYNVIAVSPSSATMDFDFKPR